MKTTVVIADSLFARAQRVAKARGITLRELFEQGLRVAIEGPSVPRYALPDCRVGKAGRAFPLEGKCWEEVRVLFYGSDT